MYDVVVNGRIRGEDNSDESYEHHGREQSSICDMTRANTHSDQQKRKLTDLANTHTCFERGLIGKSIEFCCSVDQQRFS